MQSRYRTFADSEVEISNLAVTACSYVKLGSGHSPEITYFYDLDQVG